MQNMTISADNFANLMGVSKATLQAWETSHVYVPKIADNGTKYFDLEDWHTFQRSRR